jgi:hypothetical protein
LALTAAKVKTLFLSSYCIVELVLTELGREGERGRLYSCITFKTNFVTRFAFILCILYSKIVFDENTLALYSGGAHPWSHNLFSYSCQYVAGEAEAAQ